MKFYAPLLVSAAALLSNSGPAYSGEAKPEAAPGAPPHQWDVRIVDGMLFKDQGAPAPATLRNVVDYLVELQPANVVLAPTLSAIRIENLKLAGLRWEGALEALRIASGNAFVWSSPPSAAEVDPQTGIPVPSRSADGASLYALEPDPAGPRRANERVVEVFNLAGYLEGQDVEAVEGRLKQLQSILGESLEQVRAGSSLAESELVPSVRFHAGASLLVVVGTTHQVEVARRIILALPGTAASQAGTGMVSGLGGMGGGFSGGGSMGGGGFGGTGGGMDEVMMRRYGLRPGFPQAETPWPHHAVRPGETLESIARLYGSRADAFLAANPGLDPQRMRVGQSLRIPGNVPKPPGTTAGGTGTAPPAASSKAAAAPTPPPAVAPPPPAK